MILVQSRQQQLSGNRIVKCIFGILICGLMACSGTKKLDDSSKVVKPNPSKEEKPEQAAHERMDTISWTEIDRTRDYEKTVQDLEMDKRASYKVSLLLPFELSVSNMPDVSRKDTKLSKLTHYYAGLKMALDKLDEEGVILDLNVVDIESGNFDQKLRECIDSDVIIGPRDTDQLSTTANFGKINEIPVVSPWKTGSKISTENPFFIQMKNSLKRHFEKIVEHAKMNYSDDQIFLLGRKKKEDMTYMKYIQNVAAAINNDGENQPFQEYFLEEDSLKIGETAFDSIFFDDKASVFILPNWSFTSDEDFVYNTVRKMSGEKGLNEVVLYGMPILFESEKVIFEHYRALNMRVCRSSFVDRNSVASKEFMQEYFRLYNDFPSEDAYEAYDLMIFIGRSLNNYGKKFQFFLDTYESSLLQTKFDIQRVYKNNDTEAINNIEYFQNDHLFILSFIDNRFIAN